MKNSQHLAIGMLTFGLVAWGVCTVRPERPEHSTVQAAPAGPGPDRRWAPALPPDPGAVAPSPLPQGLSGTLAPDGLQVDSAGHLVRSRRVRDVFDYFLAAANERSPAQIDVMVRDHIAARLQPPAQQEAVELWEGYLRYLRAISSLNADGVGQQNLARTRDWLAQRSAYRKQLLPAVALTWFAADEIADQEQLERIGIFGDPSLTPQQRKDKLTVLNAKNPMEAKATTAGAQVSALGKLVDDLRQQGSTPEEIGAAVATRSDPQTGARIQAWMRDDIAWEQRYAQYQREREAIDLYGGIAEIDRKRQIEQLRNRHFPVQAELLRAFARDQVRIATARY